MSVLCVDLGGSGATVEMSETGDIIAIHDNPTTKEANGRRATNAALWAAIIARSHARVAFIEWIAARPTDARVAAFSFGRCRGLAEGICGSLSIPIVWLTPPVWKRLADIPPGSENKDVALTRAIAKWPDRAEWFSRKCDVDRAEACLIGWAGLQREARNG